MTDGKWMPIETAPKDGTEILAWDGMERVIAHWGYGAEWDYEADDMGATYGRWEDNWDGRMEPQPTHWMPLPAAPSQGE